MKRPVQLFEATAGVSLVTALVAFALIRVQPVDVPWHLATARLAEALGHWPVRNSFSYTFPEHPIYQQYPVFQAVLYGVYRRFGWAGLSVVTCVGWSAVYFAFMRWAGPCRAALARPLFWMVALFALQRRMILRPDLFSMMALVAMLLALDHYRRGRRGAIWSVPLVHLFWVNSHQLFPLSLLVQCLFIGHVLVVRKWRWDVDRADVAVPVGPLVAALVLSIAASFATPLGFDIVRVGLHTFGSLSSMKDQVDEFVAIWRAPYELALALSAGLPAIVVLWRGRARWSPFELALWLMSLGLVLSAVRGLMFFGIVSVAVTQRALRRLDEANAMILPPVRPRLARMLRLEGLVLAVVLAGLVVHKRWISPPLVLGGTQPGMGRAVGGWADEAIAFLRANPPPGRMMNMPWSSGNALIWGLPEHPVFIDPRFESYPHSFLRAAVEAYSDDAKLAALMARYRPSWVFAQHFHEGVRARVASLFRVGWTAVYADAGQIVLVRPGPDTAAYREAHRIDLERAQPADLVSGPPDLRRGQLVQYGRLLRALGFERRATEIEKPTTDLLR